jgi:AraC-like DNA-binding protein
MPGYVFHSVPAELADVVEAIWHADFPEGGAARSMVLPVVSPILCFHYRSAPLLRMGGPDTDRLIDPGGYRMTGICSAAARIRANGPVGGVMVRLNPEGAGRLRGVSLRELAEGAAALGDVFSDGEMSLLDEQLLEGASMAARVGAVQRFLLDHLSGREGDPLACAAASALRRDSSVSVSDLAIRLDVSERHLSRRFLASFGTSPKRFARIARFGAAVRTGRRIGWAETAAACGFSDQAHMVNEFSTMAGMAPNTLFRATSLGLQRASGLSRTESDFFNTFVAERPTSV